MDEINSTLEDIDMMEDSCDENCQESLVTFWIEGVAVPIIATFGILGNVVCVFVFNQKSVELKPSFSNILKCLSIFDSLFLIGVIMLYPLPILSRGFSMYEPYFSPYILPLTQIALTGSVFSVLAVATERYFTICKPFTYNLGSLLDGFVYILVIVIFSFMYNLARFFEYKTEIKAKIDPATNESYDEISLGLSDLRKDPVYTTVCIILNTVVMGIFPILTLSILNYRILKTMKIANEMHNRIASNQRRDGAMTALLSGVVLVMVLCHTPKTIINAYESYQMLMLGSMKYHPLWGRIIIKLSHLLLTVSSAVNILIYSYKDMKFRYILVNFIPQLMKRVASPLTGIMPCCAQKTDLSNLELIETPANV